MDPGWSDLLHNQATGFNPVGLEGGRNHFCHQGQWGLGHGVQYSFEKCDKT